MRGVFVLTTTTTWRLLRRMPRLSTTLESPEEDDATHTQFSWRHARQAWSGLKLQGGEHEGTLGHGSSVQYFYH